MFSVEYYNSPIGVLRIASDGKAICEVAISQDMVNSNGDTLTRECIIQLKEYFDGERKHFTIPINPSGTPYQSLVWDKLMAIDFGNCITYKDLAERSHGEKNCRSVANSVGKNPILIIVPCHRVVAKNSIGGFSCGVFRKIELLKIEGVLYESV